MSVAPAALDAVQFPSHDYRTKYAEIQDEKGPPRHNVSLHVVIIISIISLASVAISWAEVVDYAVVFTVTDGNPNETTLAIHAWVFIWVNCLLVGISANFLLLHVLQPLICPGPTKYATDYFTTGALTAYIIVHLGNAVGYATILSVKNQTTTSTNVLIVLFICNTVVETLVLCGYLFYSAWYDDCEVTVVVGGFA